MNWNPFKTKIDANIHEVRLQSYGEPLITNTTMQAGLYNGQSQLSASAQLQQQQTLSQCAGYYQQGLAGQLQMQQSLSDYQNQINAQMQAIKHAQHQMSQPIFKTHGLFVEGTYTSFSEDDYDFIIKAGMEALKKRETFKTDFEDLLK